MLTCIVIPHIRAWRTLPIYSRFHTFEKEMKDSLVTILITLVIHVNNKPFQESFSMTVWCGIINNQFPVILLHCLTVTHSLHFLENEFSVFLEKATRTPAQFNRLGTKHLNIYFPEDGSANKVPRPYYFRFWWVGMIEKRRLQQNQEANWSFELWMVLPHKKVPKKSQKSYKYCCKRIRKCIEWIFGSKLWSYSCAFG